MDLMEGFQQDVCFHSESLWICSGCFSGTVYDSDRLDRSPFMVVPVQ